MSLISGSVPVLFKLQGASHALRTGDEKSALRSRIALPDGGALFGDIAY